MSMRVRVTSSRSAGDTGLTRKPGWSEACTKRSATSRDKASRTAARLTDNCFAMPAMWSFWPGTSFVERRSARRRSNTAEVRVLGPDPPSAPKPTAILSMVAKMTTGRSIVNRKSIFYADRRTRDRPQRSKCAAAGGFYQRAHLVRRAILAEHREHGEAREGKNQVDGLSSHPTRSRLRRHPPDQDVERLAAALVALEQGLREFGVGCHRLMQPADCRVPVPA